VSTADPTPAGRYDDVVVLHPDAEQAIGSVRLEGGDVRPAVLQLGDRVARGEITADEAVARVRAERAQQQPVR